MTYYTNTNLYCIPIRKPELLAAALRFLLFFGRIQGNIAALLLDRPHDLAFGRGVQVVSSVSQEELEVVCDVSACDIYPSDGMWHGETFEDGNSVGYTISGVQDDSCCSARRIS